MRPDPLHDAVQFLTRPGWFTPVFWLLCWPPSPSPHWSGGAIPHSERRATSASGDCVC